MKAKHSHISCWGHVWGSATSSETFTAKNYFVIKKNSFKSRNKICNNSWLWNLYWTFNNWCDTIDSNSCIIGTLHLHRNAAFSNSPDLCLKIPFNLINVNRLRALSTRNTRQFSVYQAVLYLVLKKSLNFQIEFRKVWLLISYRLKAKIENRIIVAR